jgi:putative hydrolase of the HAD superfamily
VLNEVKALVFDLDGTLYASSELGREIQSCACRYLAGILGITPDAADNLIRVTKARLSSASGCETTLTRACMELGGDIRELHRRFAAEIDPLSYLQVDSRVVGLLKELGEAYALHIYTNNNTGLSRRVMEAIGVAGLFRRTFTIEDSWRPKPDRDTLEMIYAEIGAQPEECLFVGDRYDIDLRLPAAMGSAVFLATAPDELLNLGKLLHWESA